MDRWFSRRPSSVLGLWIPGVSMNTTWLRSGGRVPDAPDLVAGGLGPVGDDRDLGADQLVEEGRLPDVGPPDQGGDPGPEGPRGGGLRRFRFLRGDPDGEDPPALDPLGPELEALEARPSRPRWGRGRGG